MKTLHFCSLIYLSLLFFFYSKLSCFFFFFVSHLSILQDLKLIAIYVRNINKKNKYNQKTNTKKWYWRKRVSHPTSRRP